MKFNFGATIHRVVRLDIADPVFEKDKTEIRLQWKPRLNLLLDELSKRGISQLLVEGGPTVIASFLKERLVDEVCVYIAPKILGAQGGVGINQQMAELAEIFGLYYFDTKLFGDDVRLTGLSKKALDEVLIAEG